VDSSPGSERRSGVCSCVVCSEQKDKPASSAPVTVASPSAVSAPKPGSAPAPKPGGAAPTPAPVPPGALALYPTEELSFRSQPVISNETLIRRVPPTEQLISLEPANQAIPKVGVQGQWIKVRDQNKKEGYVAAWYVKYAGDPLHKPPAQPPHLHLPKAGSKCIRLPRRSPCGKNLLSVTHP